MSVQVAIDLWNEKKGDNSQGVQESTQESIDSKESIKYNGGTKGIDNVKESSNNENYNSKCIKRLKRFGGREYGTYDYESGEMVSLRDGWQLTFHQNKGMTDYYGKYSDGSYDKRVEEMKTLLDSKAYIGVFGNPEISFTCRDEKMAKELAKEHNQYSIWYNKLGCEEKNEYYDFATNPTDSGLEDIIFALSLGNESREKIIEVVDKEILSGADTNQIKKRLKKVFNGEKNEQ